MTVLVVPSTGVVPLSLAVGPVVLLKRGLCVGIPAAMLSVNAKDNEVHDLHVHANCGSRIACLKDSIVVVDK